MPIRAGRWLAVILLLGFALRVVWTVANAGHALGGDEETYDAIAWNLASGRGYSMSAADVPPVPTAMRGPGYVLPLAATYRLFGHHVLPMLLLQCLLDTLAIWLVARIGRRVFPHRPELALGGALLYALYPPFLEAAASLLTETSINAAVLLAIDRGLAWGQGGSRRAFIASGAAVGFVALSKPQLAPIAILVVLAAVPNWRSRRFWACAVAQVAIVAAVLAPWTIRNAITFGRLIPGVTNGGVTFWGGTGPVDGRTFGSLGDPGVPAHVLAATAGLGESERDRWLYAEGLRVIREHPARWAGLLLKKFARLWFNLAYDDPPSKVSLVIAAFNFVMLVLAFAAFAKLRPEPAAARLMLGLFAFFSIVHLLIFAILRYSYPAYAYLFCFSGAMLLAPLLGRRGGDATGR